MRRVLRWGWVSASLCLAGLDSAAAARQDAEPLELHRLALPVKLDGTSDELAWQPVHPLPLVTYQPTFGAEPSERSEIRLAYDDHNLYAAGRFFLRDPTLVRARSLSRDRTSGDDLFRLLIDSYNDNQNAVEFVTTPNGIRYDQAISDDGRETNSSWNGHWDAVAVRTREGWFAEIRIPLSSLRFQEIGGRVTMGIIASRFTAYNNELVTFPALPPRFASAQYRASIAHKVTLSGVRSRRPLYITPYGLLGSTRSHATAQAGNLVPQHELEREAGVDVKYGMTSNLTLDLTANTDFAQVEVDDQQVNLTRFSLFFPEKRQFFLERAGIFAFNTGNRDNSRLFHSRRVGLNDDGEPLRIYGGARLVGRVGAWDVGVLDMQTEAAAPGKTENLGVIRARRQIVNSGSYVGGILTGRLGVPDCGNLAYGIEAQLRAGSNDYVGLQYAQTFDEGRHSSGLDASMLRAGWERRSLQGLSYSAWGKWSGPDYNPRLGFADRTDYSNLIASAQYGWFPGARTVFQSIQPAVATNIYLRNRDGSRESSHSGIWLNFVLKSGGSGDLSFALSEEDLPTPLALSSDVEVPAGFYRYPRLAFSYYPPPGAGFRTGFSASYGGLYDGKRVRVLASPTWVASDHLELGAEYELNRVRFATRGQTFNGDLMRLRARGALDRRFSASAFLQYNHPADLVVASIRLRLHLAEGRDLFLVYNERLNTDRRREVPPLPWSDERSLILKYTHPIVN